MRKGRLDGSGGLDEVHRVGVVLFNAGCNGKNIGIKNDVFRRKSNRVYQDAVAPFANLHFPLDGVRLAFFIERHHDHGSPVAPGQSCLL